MAYRSFATALRRFREERPNELAVLASDRELTWLDLDRRTNRLARVLAGLGVGSGQFVSIGLPNSCEFIESVLAVWKLGAIPQPISFRLPAAERTAILSLAQPVAVIGIDEWTQCPSLPAGFEASASVADAALADAIAPSWGRPWPASAPASERT